MKFKTDTRAALRRGNRKLENEIDWSNRFELRQVVGEIPAELDFTKLEGGSHAVAHELLGIFPVRFVLDKVFDHPDQGFSVVLLSVKLPLRLKLNINSFTIRMRCGLDKGGLGHFRSHAPATVEVIERDRISYSVRVIERLKVGDF